MIAIVDYGVGNLGSVQNMLKKAGTLSTITSDEKELAAAAALILPGIGAFDHCMQQFNNSGLRNIVEKRVLHEETPVLGICVGLQMLMDESEEGNEPGLGWIAGKTLRFKKERLGSLRIPHMGWSDVSLPGPNRLTNGLPDDARFYFVHSYHVQPVNRDYEIILADYGYPFAAGLNRGNIYGVQFHPEKSHKFGMKVLENFSKLA